MTRAAGEAFDRIDPDKRFLMFSRSSYIGMHRYGGIWTGDNMAWWSHILLCLKMMPSLNMCGFLYTGCDLGGFGADTTRDLLLRFLGLASSPRSCATMRPSAPASRSAISSKIRKISGICWACATACCPTCTANT